LSQGPETTTSDQPSDVVVDPTGPADDAPSTPEVAAPRSPGPDGPTGGDRGGRRPGRARARLLLIRKEFFLPLLVVAICLGAWEMRRALQSARINAPIVPILLGAVSMLMAAYVRGAEALAITFGLTATGIIVWRAAEGARGALRDIGGGLFVAFYPCLIAGFASLLLAEPDGHLRIVFFVLVTVFSDIGGYAVGVLFGKHPMAPSVSPKKSWEGFAGSVVVCTIVGATSMHYMLGGSVVGRGCDRRRRGRRRNDR
jgi:CDP-diglyceride synthetase